MSMFYELMMKKKGMPERYQEVEYIQSKGTQYINTGVKFTENSSYDIIFEILDTSANKTVVGSNLGFAQNSDVVLMYAVRKNLLWYFYSSYTDILPTDSPYTTLKNRLVKTISGSNAILEIYNNDTLIETIQKTNQNFSNLPYFLFATNQNGSPNTVSNGLRIYSAKFYNGSSLVRNFVPVYDTITQKYGMWESVQGKFYGNDGTGDFDGSIVGYTVVGSPTTTDGVVSGFSSSDYLLLPVITNTDITEVCMKINIPSSALGLNKYFSCLIGAIQMTFYSATTKFTYANVNITGLGDIFFNVTGNISPDTDYWLKYINKGVKCQVYWSTDGINFNLGATKDNTITSASNYLYIGGNGSRYFEGKIYLNECYIKKNNKLWFNGQQA